MAKQLRSLRAYLSEASIRTPRETAIKGATVEYVDGTIERYVVDEYGRFRVAEVTCGEVRRPTNTILIPFDDAMFQEEERHARD